jgi:predicted nucleotidyltransferase
MSDTRYKAARQKELIDGIVAKVRRENTREEAETASMLDSARAEAHRLARGLAALDSVRKVIHFGSSATGRRFRTDSDIDLAIVGGDILEAMRITESSMFHVDIVDLETIPSPLREAILKEGVVLHEKG